MSKINTVKGEVLGDLGHDYQIVSVEKWLDTWFFEHAADQAANAFLKEGAILPITFDDGSVVVQQYPKKLAFIFQRNVCGKQMFVPYVYDLPEKLIVELKTAGRWQERVTN